MSVGRKKAFSMYKNIAAFSCYGKPLLQKCFSILNLSKVTLRSGGHLVDAGQEFSNLHFQTICAALKKCVSL